MKRQKRRSMKKLISLVSLCLCLSQAATSQPAAEAPAPATDEKGAGQPWNSGGDGHHESLSERATNPISQLGRLKLKEAYTPSYDGKTGYGNTYELQGLIPIPWPNSTDSGQVIRVTLPVTTPRGDATAYGDSQIFDLCTMETEWGLIGVGPTMVIPTAGTTAAGKGKWQVGPALALFCTKIPHFQIGVLAQNPISVAGDPTRSSVNELLLQPHLTWHVGDGWYLNSDAQMTFDWLNDGRNIPVNLGVGRTFKLGDQPVNLNLQYEWTVYGRNMTLPNSTIKLNFEFLFL